VGSDERRNPMRISEVAWLAVVALVLASQAQAQASQANLTVSGVVVSTGNTSMVVRIDDGAHPIPFVIGTTTVLPSNPLSVGSRVSVRYHPLGSTGQMADEVTLLQAPGPRVLAQSAPPSPSNAPDQSDSVHQSPSPEEPPTGASSRLPATASPLPLVALIGLAALLGSLSLRALARSRN
jgi:hypothetical protein